MLIQLVSNGDMPFDTHSQQAWTFSILVDISGRIEEFRGQVSESLGAAPRALANKSILDLVNPEDHAIFLRHFGQLGASQLPPPFVARMIGPETSPREFSIKFEKGQSLRSTWLLFTTSKPEALEGAESPAPAIAFQDESHLLNLIEMAAKQENSSLDVTIIGVGALKDAARRDRLTMGRGAEFEEAVDKTVLEGAELGLAAKTTKGSYSVVHDRARPPASLEDEIREAASRFGISESNLGLRSVTVQVSAGESVAELRARFRGAYQSLGEEYDVADDNSALLYRVGLFVIGIASIGVGAGIGVYLAG